MKTSRILTSSTTNRAEVRKDLGPYNALGRAGAPTLARPSLCALSALRGTSGGASMTTPVGRAQHHDASMLRSPVTPRARSTGFYHGSELSVYLAPAPIMAVGLRVPYIAFTRPFALPHSKHLRTPRIHPLLWRIIPGGRNISSSASLAYRGRAMPPFPPEPRLCELCLSRGLGS